MLITGECRGSSDKASESLYRRIFVHATLAPIYSVVELTYFTTAVYTVLVAPWGLWLHPADYGCTQRIRL